MWIRISPTKPAVGYQLLNLDNGSTIFVTIQSEPEKDWYCVYMQVRPTIPNFEVNKYGDTTVIENVVESCEGDNYNRIFLESFEKASQAYEYMESLAEKLGAKEF